MQYIVFDLEFNQDPDSILRPDLESDKTSVKKRYPYEIIQIGAVKLDDNYLMTDTFNRFIKPSIYANISPYITELTGITLESLQSEMDFSHVYNDFIEFIGDKETILCVWGTSDIKEMYKNIKYHNLDESLLPKTYINIQPYASAYLGYSMKRLLKLSYCIEAMDIEIKSSFHDALHDALYTAEIFKKIYNSTIKPKLFNISKEAGSQPQRQVRKVLDFNGLIAQFEKMFSREMTEEEKEIIRLAYHMGKTGQFLKTDIIPKTNT